MTASASFAAARPPGPGISAETVDVMFICIAAFPIGLALDRWFGLLPALAARCGGFETLRATLEWHWACTPATSLMMLLAAPVWIGLKALTPADRSLRHDYRAGPLAALFCHAAMLAGMVFGLAAGPSLAALAGIPWTTGAAIGAMACGMVCGMAVALICGMMRAPATSRLSPLTEGV
jgi:hypothetical protein